MFFQAWQTRWRPVGALPMLRDVLVMAAVAAAVDYGVTPKWFTPGWEYVLSKRGMAVGFGGLAVGLAAGALLAQSARRRAFGLGA